ncbi:putative HTH-type transcriptional regulator YvaP [Jeotgalicoccus coquinae]|uniref:DNA-binding HxlR family transcriptional regulator n=1 Tax=Jeotgalicoccus coquinae TaxID=709509 RepID=A0A6V7RRV1_9STAP|nr:helix-turn-helix domain-containing protein [Jeotgalicoccus coquinae]MBB6423271.1 DNA-binding HxlR family transcriptional regulator [Jeotgalicoccus coquinae]GGE09332.1 putative HTH-type transcriptional regulator YvaP [Jeotgalicoccus coquinae]CAD2081843.1 HTH-type transcriptional regulator YodB [Jeotgalicoccus coquinae]
MSQNEMCPRFEKAVNILSQRWTALLIYQMLDGNSRFGEIQTATGVSGKVLSDRLKSMEQEGLINREVIPETPVVIKYSLTEKGLSLEPVLKDIEKWSQDWIESDNKVEA